MWLVSNFVNQLINQPRIFHLSQPGHVSSDTYTIHGDRIRSIRLPTGVSVGRNTQRQSSSLFVSVVFRTVTTKPRRLSSCYPNGFRHYEPHIHSHARPIRYGRSKRVLSLGPVPIVPERLLNWILSSVYGRAGSHSWSATDRHCVRNGRLIWRLDVEKESDWCTFRWSLCKL